MAFASYNCFHKIVSAVYSNHSLLLHSTETQQVNLCPFSRCRAIINNREKINEFLNINLYWTESCYYKPTVLHCFFRWIRPVMLLLKGHHIIGRVLLATLTRVALFFLINLIRYSINNFKICYYLMITHVRMNSTFISNAGNITKTEQDRGYYLRY